MRRTLGLATLVFALLCTVSTFALAPQTTAPSQDQLAQNGLTLDWLSVDSAVMATCNAAPATAQELGLGFEDALFGSCNSNQCYLACVQKGYWAGYCISGTCVCQSNPSF